MIPIDENYVTGANCGCDVSCDSDVLPKYRYRLNSDATAF